MCEGLGQGTVGDRIREDALGRWQQTDRCLPPLPLSQAPIAQDAGLARATQPSIPQTIFLSACNGRTLTTLRAGLALKIVSSFVNGLMPLRAFLAGIRLTTTFMRPGTCMTPGPPGSRMFQVVTGSGAPTFLSVRRYSAGS